MTINGAANTLTYEGGVGADTIKLGNASTNSTIYGDNASAVEGGDDSISLGWFSIWFLHLRQLQVMIPFMLLATWPDLSEYR